MSNKTILVVGGAGYIGSHCILDLKKAGYHPIILDNFSTGNRDIAAKLETKVIDGSAEDSKLVLDIFKEFKPSAVMHFAAHAYVGESVTEPSKYYKNNVVATLGLLDSMRLAGCNNFIFSSTCATYGMPSEMPISEECVQNPINPYGRSKLMVEYILKDYERAYGLNSIILRYFNASGAHPTVDIGERHDPETHLIPLAISAALGGPEISVFGDDYPTADGTCIRDYIHVCDLAQAHRLALEKLLAGGKSTIYNIGNGNGYSILDVFEAIQATCGSKVKYRIAPRREGDPATLVASANKIRTELGWNPEFPSIEAIVKTAVDWYRKDNRPLP